MKKDKALLIREIALLVLTGTVAFAAEPVGADCGDPPNLVPFADLRGCNLSGMEMEGVDLSHANLSGAILDNASLFCAILHGAIFDNASLRNTYMEGAEAQGASFVNTDMRGVDLYFATVTDANLTGADLSNTWLSAIDFERSNLQNAIFTGSTLWSVDLKDADLRGADLSFTRLVSSRMHNADLRGANLLGAELASEGMLDGIIWGNTTCADGSNSDDDDGDNFSCNSNFLLNEPPTVSLTSPAGNITVTIGDTITVSADASDSDGVVSWVEFYANGVRINLDGTAPYTHEWTPPVTGTYEITARATDDDQDMTTSQAVTVTVVPAAQNVPPVVQITSPAKNSTVYRSQGTTIKANAADSDGFITKVEFYAGTTLLNIDTSSPYTHFWKPGSRGNVTLTAKAYDQAGAVTISAPVSVRVK